MKANERAKRIRQTKAEIIRDVKKGIVPASVESFGDLHDYVDANCYGGMRDDDMKIMNDENEHELDPAAPNVCTFDDLNIIQDTVHAWIQEGGIFSAIERSRHNRMRRDGRA